MISLKNILEHSLQEIFDQVKNHLLTQNAQSVDWEGACVYRSLNGLKCALGCLISDDEYSSNMEYNGIYEVCNRHSESLGEGMLKNHELHSLLNDLQSLHDYDDPAYWQINLKKIAKRYSLTY